MVATAARQTMVFARSMIRYRSVADPQTELRMRLRELAMSRVAYGYRRLHILLWREGWRVNHKRVYRLYREEGLGMRKKVPRRRKACLKRQLRPVAVEKNECWSMDFMSDELFDGRRIRVLTLVDNHTRESLAIHVAQRIRGMEVVEVLEEVSIESFNARFRLECLNEHWFMSLEDAREKTKRGRRDYNENRPHSFLGNVTPEEFTACRASPGPRSKTIPEAKANDSQKFF
jgi:putative transposase